MRVGRCLRHPVRLAHQERGLHPVHRGPRAWTLLPARSSRKAVSAWRWPPRIQERFYFQRSAGAPGGLFRQALLMPAPSIPGGRRWRLGGALRPSRSWPRGARPRSPPRPSDTRPSLMSWWQLSSAAGDRSTIVSCRIGSATFVGSPGSRKASCFRGGPRGDSIMDQRISTRPGGKNRRATSTNGSTARKTIEVNEDMIGLGSYGKDLDRLSIRRNHRRR